MKKSYSWNDIRMFINGKEITGITSIKITQPWISKDLSLQARKYIDQPHIKN
jgi:hypothetical protein